MNKKALVRVANIGGPPPAPGAPVLPLGDTERIMVSCQGEVILQIPLDFAETQYGAICVGDILEVEIRKVPQLGRRIGEDSLLAQ